MCTCQRVIQPAIDRRRRTGASSLCIAALALEGVTVLAHNAFFSPSWDRLVSPMARHAF
jgi:hypothetical protein